MDTSNSQSLDIANLSAADKAELQKFVAGETQKARIQNSVHSLTDVCWRKCVPGKISSAVLEKGEVACAQNCVERFMDANMLVLKGLEALRSQGV
ncbi:MAG: Mitochondrial import inner membrane translocase subunit tim8 [Thelocarpon impressellum]|nr:MAG: Mitochondrial import inner membrane translocase subunit tim8 [Thelocarpon impressellum]